MLNADCVSDLFESFSHSSYKHISPVLRAEDDVVLAAKDAVASRLVLHNAEFYINKTCEVPTIPGLKPGALRTLRVLFSVNILGDLGISLLRTGTPVLFLLPKGSKTF
mgnify:CR=1 FL=1